ncbi:tetratricopeptide repeat protein [Congregibacter litoralis]|uniref:Putative 2OG-Fe(II) oxygenase/TPR repeat protein n=1 Tax=Congregibacter litoralis KT71 TaxID=314285 RepID=A4ABW2_9GAMM|nr:tetratricopeptide repeat protein [Congregibacter litoralis]EAQ96412.2 putative 2OG-Fe(II) oxygenase/TPR repeat protein [Congregibacter litoralis KT71]
MNPNYRQALQQAHQMLRAGKGADCARLCQQLLQQMPGEANALQLLALGQQQSGDLVGADGSFRAAIAASPGQPQAMLAYATFLRNQGRFAEAQDQLQQALAGAPNSPEVWQALARLHYQQESWQEAQRCITKATELAPQAPPLWELAAAIAQKQGDVAQALALCRQGIGHNPKASRLHYSLAQLLRQECDFVEAAAAYEQALKLGFDQPDLYRNRAEALLDAGDIEAALACANTGVERFPGHPLLQRTAAQLSFSSGAQRDHLEKLRAAVKREPRNPALWQTLVQLMKRLGEESRVEETLRDAQRLGCPETPSLQVLGALDMAQRGEKSEALNRLEQISLANPDDSYVQHYYAMQLLRCKEAERAESLCAQWLLKAPFDQTLLAYRGTALQLLGDPREDWLLDYQRMVVPVEVPAPPEYATREAYFAELTRVLEGLHHSNAQPIEQSVRGGTQTNGFLFRLKESLLRGLETQLQLAIASALQTMPTDEDHPFWCRNTRPQRARDLRMAGAWSVRLRDQGYHANHIHPEGWVSSALYISLPDEVQQGEGTEGHIQFGTPMIELGLDLAPRRVVKPVVGTLVLFPSYMWHGTLPFHSHQPRITVAFDLLPGA